MWLRGHYLLCSAWIAAISRQMTEIFFSCLSHLFQVAIKADAKQSAAIWLVFHCLPLAKPRNNTIMMAFTRKPKINMIALSCGAFKKRQYIVQTNLLLPFSITAQTHKAQKQHWTKHMKNYLNIGSRFPLPLWLQHHMAVQTLEKWCVVSVCAVSRNPSPFQISEPLVDCCVYASACCQCHPCLDALQGFYVLIPSFETMPLAALFL